MARLLFETHSLCKYFRLKARAEVRALHKVSLCLEQGSFTVLTGTSGSGKTTLLTLLGGLERPTQGRVLFEGQNLADCSDVALAQVRRKLGFVFQDFSLIPKLTVVENITYPLIPRGVPKRVRQRRAQELLIRLGIGDKLTVLANALSGGEQQRVAIARALAGEPEALLADEPTSNLDPETGRTLLGMFQKFHQEGKTVVMASHDPEVISLATQVIELEGGKLKNLQSSP